MKTMICFSQLIFLLLAITSCERDEGTTVPAANSKYVVFAWNDLGMHCLNPTYDELVILPPYNNLHAQVIRRGNPPEIVSAGFTAEFSIINNSYSYGKREYGGFWTYFESLFTGPVPAHDTGLTGTSLSGLMTLDGDGFLAAGIPVVPVNDANVWNPYQVAEIKIKDGTGAVIATTRATIPTSDEINCAKCHSGGSNTAFTNILLIHDLEEGTTLNSQKPVLCAKCHGSPALGTVGEGTSGIFLSEAIHGYHSDKGAGCYDCHPGATTKCMRSIEHMGTGTDGNCIECHGSMANVASTIDAGRIPWVTEPKCSSCHGSVSGVETNSTLYRNATGHGNIACTACHGSPHAMYPSSQEGDNYQPEQYMGNKIKTIGSCGVCHSNSRGEGAGEDFAETHGGTTPEHKNTCHVCHTAVPSTTTSWPHAYTWQNSN